MKGRKNYRELREYYDGDDSYGEKEEKSDYGYDDDYDEEDKNEYESEYNSRRKQKKREMSRLLTLIQITVCGIILVVILALKIMGGNLYTTVRNWYLQYSTQTIIPDEQIDNVKNKVLDLFPSSSSAASSAGPSTSSSEPDPSSAQPASSAASGQDDGKGKAKTGSAAESAASSVQGQPESQTLIS